MAAQSPAVTRSTFVTVLAWIFIVLAGFVTLISVMQNIMIAVLFPVDKMQEAANQTGNAGAPWFATFMLNHIQLFFLSFLVVSASTLAAAIGLLKRMNWARILFIGIMALGIAWNIGGVIFMFFLLSSMPEISAKTPAGFDVMWKVMLGFNVLFVAGFVWLFGWIIKRLMSDDVRREFAAV
jgi:hypothetical protein